MEEALDDETVQAAVLARAAVTSHTAPHTRHCQDTIESLGHPGITRSIPGCAVTKPLEYNKELVIKKV